MCACVMHWRGGRVAELNGAVFSHLLPPVKVEGGLVLFVRWIARAAPPPRPGTAAHWVTTLSAVFSASRTAFPTILATPRLCLSPILRPAPPCPRRCFNAPHAYKLGFASAVSTFDATNRAFIESECRR